MKRGGKSQKDLVIRLQAALRHQQSGQVTGVVDLYSSILKDFPRSDVALNCYGGFLASLGRHREAADSFLRAATFNQREGAYLTNLAISYRHLGMFDEAGKQIEKALLLKPANMVAALNTLGQILREKGQHGEAVMAFRRAIVLQPDQVFLHNNLLSALLRVGEPDAIAEQLRVMTNIFKSLGPGQKQERMHLGFELGTGMDASGSYAEAFSFFDAANMAAREIINHRPEADREYFQMIRNSFPPAVFSDRGAGEGVQGGPVPVFIVGMPRSGTSLVEQILAPLSGRLRGRGIRIFE